MKEIRTEFIEDDTREAQIKHWEVTLNNAQHAVYVAQQTLERLYRSRYREVERDLGSTGLQLALDAGRVPHEPEALPPAA